MFRNVSDAFRRNKPEVIANLIAVALLVLGMVGMWNAVLAIKLCSVLSDMGGRCF